MREPFGVLRGQSIQSYRRRHPGQADDAALSGQRDRRGPGGPRGWRLRCVERGVGPALRVLLRTTVPLTAVLGILAAGCSSEPDPALQDQPTVKSSARPTTPVATPALDECSLLKPSEVAPQESTKTYGVTSRSAAPDPSGDGWRVICGYGVVDSSDERFIASVETTTGISSQRFSEQIEPADPSTPPPDEPDPGTPSPSTDEEDPTIPRRVNGLGEQAWVVAGGAPRQDGADGDQTPAPDDDGSVGSEGASGGGEPTSAQIHILRGTTAVTITVRTPDRATDRDLDRVTDLGRQALSRLPETFTVPPVRLDGACAKVNRALAVKATGVELPGARSVTTETRSACELSGTSGLITITADGTSRARRAFEQDIDAPQARSIGDVGDAAYSTTSDPLDDLWIRSGEQILHLQRYDRPEPDPAASSESAVRGDRLAFVQQVVSAFGG